jgi:prophage regulatory protein
MPHIERDPADALGYRLLRPRQVCEVIGLQRTRLYDLIRSGDFPAPLRISAKAVAWRSDIVAEWIATRPSARPAKAEAPAKRRRP